MDNQTIFLGICLFGIAATMFCFTKIALPGASPNQKYTFAAIALIITTMLTLLSYFYIGIYT